MAKSYVVWLKLGLRQKVAVILLGVLAPLLVALIIHIALIDYLRSLQERHHHLVLALEQVHVLERVALDIEDAFRGYVLTRKDLFLESLKEAEMRLQPALSKMEHLAARASILNDKTAEIRQRLHDFLTSKHELLVRLQAGYPEEVLKYVESRKAIEASQELKSELRFLEDRFAQRLESMEAGQLWTARVAFWGLLGAAVAGIALGYFAIRLFGESIVGPVAALQRSVWALEANSAESTEIRLIAGRSSDEISQLAHSYLEMVDRVRRQIRELEALSAIGHEINIIDPDGLEGVLRRITNHAAELLQVDICLVMLRNDQMGCWIVEAASGVWSEGLNKSVMLWEEFPLSVQAFETKQPVIGEDLRRDRGPEIMRRNQFGQSMLSIPLLSQGVAFGVLVLMQERKVSRGEWNMALARGFANEAAIAIANARLYETASQKGRHVQTRIRELQHLAENLAHDVKAPGEQIEGLASLLRADPHSQLSDEGIHWLALIEVYSKELRKRVEHIFTLARVGSQSAAVEAVDPSVIIQDILRLRSGELEQSRTRIEVQKELPLVACHEAYLRQVFDNVISNAIKFSSGQQNPLISISWERKGEHICFKVFDNGPGIPLKDHERVFAPFVRLNPDETAGSGIGLTIVRRIVELYNGRVWIDSQVKSGCAVVFSIPAVGDLGASRFVGEAPKWTYGSM
ncbi:MAG TPA: ATP-binding protein [Nitrospiraceae bacterium]|nr:ATP-binding protein [Nitrospiraceae bacterium]